MFVQEVVCTDREDEEIDVLMSYTENDPLAITFSFGVGDTFEDWSFGRDLLIEAYSEGSAGEGNALFGMAGDEILLVTFRDGEDGEWMTFFFPKDEVQIFLEQTEKMVPFGEESKFLNIDEEWEQFVKDQL